MIKLAMEQPEHGYFGLDRLFGARIGALRNEVWDEFYGATINLGVHSIRCSCTVDHFLVQTGDKGFTGKEQGGTGRLARVSRSCRAGGWFRGFPGCNDLMAQAGRG